MARSPKWNSHCRYADVLQYFCNTIITTNERIIIGAALGFVFFIIIFYHICQALICIEKVKKQWKKRYFNCMLSLPPMLHILCLFTRTKQGLLSLLGLNRVYFPSWCFTNFLLKNFAMATYQNGHWLEDNHQMTITAKYGSHHFTGYGENAV